MPKEHRWDLIDHHGLKVLTPFVTSYLKKGLAEFDSERKTFLASAAELYAVGVCEKVSELDNALAALRLTLSFVMDLGQEAEPDPDIYRYYFENFVLRVIGFVDRAHRLVGVSLAMPLEKVEGMGGNAFVQKQIAAAHPHVQAALRAVADAVDSYKDPRNELIHATAFSSRELGLFTTIKHLGIDTGEIHTNELAQHYFAKGGTEIALTIAKLVETLKVLLDVLTPIFEKVHRQAQIKGALGWT